MPWDEYLATLALNPSSIKHAETSMLHVHYALTGGDDDTPSKQVGRGTHAALFQPREFPKMFEPSPKDDDGKTMKRTKNVVNAAAERGVELLLPADYERCITLASRTSVLPELQPFIRKGQSEVTLFTSEFGCQCKGRMDWLSLDPLAIIDLKTASRLSERTFQNDYAKYLYHVSLGLYQRWARRLLGVDDIPVYTILAETKPPYDVMMAPWIDGKLIPLRQAELDYGAQKGLEWIQEIKLAIEADEWPGRAAKGNLDVCLPTWAMPDNGDEPEVKFDE
jgi:hypothetical protein